MTIRKYDNERDLAAVQRIWREVGWVSSASDEKYLQDFLSVGSTLVADIDGEAECMVHATPGTMRYQTEVLRMSAITAVTTSRIARRQGFAKRLTAAMLASEAQAGAEVSALGMFDEGFYDRLGFGTGCYEYWRTFDPATLKVGGRFRVPKRLTVDDWQAMHQALLDRRLGHGGCTLEPPLSFKAAAGWTENGFGLGYCDGPNGELTHFIWGSSKGEHGPYEIAARAYQTSDQLLELLALIKSLGDQVSTIAMLELGDVQFQDFLVQPMRVKRNTARSEHENLGVVLAWWQLRILDLEACLEKTHLPTPPVRFNLELTDPVGDHLEEDSEWQGLGGDYIVTLGPESCAAPGHDSSLESLEASVGAFSRLWFGTQPASSLAISDQLNGSDELLEQLDTCVRLPRAHLGLDF